MSLSVIVLTKNEEDMIAGCLKSVSFADEVVVIEDQSTDRTVYIARELGATVFERKLDDFASQRNFGLSKARSDWMLFVDAGERVPDTLKEEIYETIR